MQQCTIPLISPYPAVTLIVHTRDAGYSNNELFKLVGVLRNTSASCLVHFVREHYTQYIFSSRNTFFRQTNTCPCSFIPLLRHPLRCWRSTSISILIVEEKPRKEEKRMSNVQNSLEEN